MVITEYINDKGVNPCGSRYCQIFRTGKTSRIATNNLINKKRFNLGGHNIVRANIYEVSEIYKRKTYKLIKSVDLI